MNWLSLAFRSLTTAALAVCVVQPVAGATNVCGMITTNTTWTLAGSPYVLTCDVTIINNATLTIDPGVVVKFLPTTALEVQTGTLSAVGTGSQIVVFESDDYSVRGPGIRLRPPTGGVAHFQHCEFRWLANVLSIDCCWGPNAVIGSIDQCNFWANDSCLTGYAGYVLPVTNSTFSGNGMVANDADKDFNNCQFGSNGVVLQYVSRINVANSLFISNATGAWGFRGLIRDCVFTLNGVAIDNLQEGFTLERNSITNNTVGVRVSSAGGFINPMNCNDIHGNTTWDVELTTPYSVNLPNLWWGTTVASLIDAKIKDGFDDNSLGFVNYAGLLPGQYAAQPACACTAPTFTAHPTGANRYQGQSVTFTATPAGSGPLTYQWKRNGVPVANFGRFSGASTASLTINPIARPGSDPLWTDSGAYTCTITNLCGEATSNAAFLNVTWCPADIGDNGVVSVQDIYDFMSMWSAGCP